MDDALVITSPATTKAKRPSIPADTIVFAIGDIHGCLDQLRVLHRRILCATARVDADRRVVVYIGDYIDRGQDSRGVIDLLLDEPLPSFERIYLLGNHEAFMRAFLEGGGPALPWLANGGAATCRSYGIDVDRVRRAGFRERGLRKALREALPPRHAEFFRSLRLHHVEGDYLFVHAGIRPGVPLQAQDPQDLIWIRDAFLEANEDFGKVVVHGHTPFSSPAIMPNRIGIDTGACYGGPLTALQLHGTDQQILQA